MNLPSTLKVRSLVLSGAVLATAVFCMADPAGTPSNGGNSAMKMPAVPVKFKHPGLLNNLEELQLVKKKIEAGEEPWKSAFEQMKASKLASLNYKPHPHEIVSSGFLGAGGYAGGVCDLNDDSLAAYTQALMWIFTGNEQYAENAVKIFNAWSVLKSSEGGNWYLELGWVGAMLPEGAELIRATYPKWRKEDIAKFSEMLSRTFLPVLHNRMAYGNRELATINAMMAIGVFNDDRAAFAEGMAHWISYIPSWIYLKEDGPEPVKPDYWLTGPSNEELAKLDEGLFPDPKQSWIFAEEQTKAFMKEKKLTDDHSGFERYDKYTAWNKAPDAAFVDGLCAETFRDMGHCDMGLNQLSNMAEIAWHQGIDLYSIHAKRITAFMELEALLRVGDTWPKDFYRVQTTGMTATYEIAYNHYHNRMGMDLPNTRKLIDMAIRPCVTKRNVESPGWSYVNPEPGVRASQINVSNLTVAWETLTHAELGGSKTPAK